MIQVKIPMDLYHITKVEFVNDILNEGLIVNKERNVRFEYDDDDESRKGVYMCSSWKTILNMDDTFCLDKYAILKINISGLEDKLIPDKDYDLDPYADNYTEEEIKEQTKNGIWDQFAWFYNGTIDKNRITYVGDVIWGKDFTGPDRTGM